MNKKQSIDSVDKEEIQSHLSIWQKSGENLASYCRNHGLNYQRMKQWKSRLGFPKLRPGTFKRESKIKSGNFIALPAPDLHAEAAPVCCLFELTFSNGTHLRIHHQVSADYLRTLLKA